MTHDPAELDPDVRELWLLLRTACEERGIDVFLIGTYRTPAEQDALYARGRTTPGPIVTNARGGWSWHNWRRALDIAIRDFPGDPSPDDVYNGPWALVGALGEHLGLEWGGRWAHFADLPHFQSTKGLTLTQMNARGATT
jgi:peptidoglycan L-alanyl-D-glutamate endopeptidase CwlK